MKRITLAVGLTVLVTAVTAQPLPTGPKMVLITEADEGNINFICDAAMYSLSINREQKMQIGNFCAAFVARVRSAPPPTARQKQE